MLFKPNLRQNTLLILVTILFLLISCNSQTPTPVADCVPPIVRIETEIGEASAGQVIQLDARSTGMNLTYQWSDEEGNNNFSSPTELSTMYTVPIGTDEISIQFIASNDCGEDDGPLIINIVPTPTPMPTETATQAPKPTETPIPGHTSTATAGSTPVPTSMSTATNTSTATATIFIPSSTPTIPRPVITDVGVEINVLHIVWTWENMLEDSQLFAVRLWGVNETDPNAENSLVWQEENTFSVEINNDRFPEGYYYINIAVYDNAFEPARVIVESLPQMIHLPDVESPDNGDPGVEG